jgi:hypothetical protein
MATPAPTHPGPAGLETTIARRIVIGVEEGDRPHAEHTAADTRGLYMSMTEGRNLFV